VLLCHVHGWLLISSCRLFPRSLLLSRGRPSREKQPCTWGLGRAGYILTKPTNTSEFCLSSCVFLITTQENSGLAVPRERRTTTSRRLHLNPRPTRSSKANNNAMYCLSRVVVITTSLLAPGHGRSVGLLVYTRAGLVFDPPKYFLVREEPPPTATRARLGCRWRIALGGLVFALLCTQASSGEILVLKQCNNYPCT
jgi:hypothetical protein